MQRMLALLLTISLAGCAGDWHRPSSEPSCYVSLMDSCGNLRRRANGGDALAMLELGKIHWWRGRHRLAMDWYRRAAMAGSGEGMARYGENLTSSAEGLAWIERGAAANDPYARRALARGLILRRSGADERRIVSLYEGLLAEGDHLAAQAYAAWLRARNPARAREIYGWVVARGHHGGDVPLAEMMRRGEGGPVDAVGARRLYEGYLKLVPESELVMEIMAEMLARGEGGPVDAARAAALREAVQRARERSPPSVDEVI